MTEDRDPDLQALFAQAETELDKNAFTEKVRADVTNARRRAKHNGRIMILGGLLALWALASWLSGVTALVARGLTAPLMPIGDPTIAVIAAPLNSMGAVLALGFLVLWFVRRALTR
ncbi:hypothetical protein [uncultured Parvibaculum sp.]|uniref:hypothetical protein n=1 Tax=uncultured Parvibaculum sp. TaxID=291828 RepID=UPI0030DB9785